MREQESGHERVPTRVPERVREGVPAHVRDDEMPEPPRRGGWRRRTGPARARDEYAGAFERVRLVRAWIAAAAALVAVLSGYVTLLERVVK